MRFQDIFLPIHLVKKITLPLVFLFFIIEFCVERHDDWFLLSVFSIKFCQGKVSDVTSIDRAFVFLFFFVRRNGVPFPPSSSSFPVVLGVEDIIIDFPNVKRVSLVVLDVPDEKKETQR